MNIPLTEAKARLTDLVRRAEAGEEVILTRHGHPAARIVPATEERMAPADAQVVAERTWLIDRLVGQARLTAVPGVCAARSQDYLYDENGLPG